LLEIITLVLRTKEDYELPKLKSTEIKIAVDAVTERLKYTFDFVFQERGFTYVLLTETSLMKEADLNYSQFELDGIPKIEVSGLLTNDEICSEGIHFDASSQLFEINGKKDIFASVFFVLTRMEEYSNPKKDAHGRFSSEQSLLFANDLLARPVCDVWSAELLEKVLHLEVPKAITSIQPTFDIDNTFAYKHKKGLRRILSVLRDRLKNDKKRLQERREIKNGGPDPYDTFDAIAAISKRFPGTQLFWLVESHQKYDRNLSLDVPEHRALIKRLSETIDINIHPSYASFGKKETIRSEIEALEAITEQRITKSRQHFLRFALPDSYRLLLAAGIQHDYSMGFAGHFGFRIGTARSIDWFDLERNERTELKIHPFVYMDGTLNEYMKLSPKASKETIQQLHTNVCKYGGTLRFIWHNETIGDYGKWNGWSEVLNYTLTLDDK